MASRRRVRRPEVCSRSSTDARRSEAVSRCARAVQSARGAGETLGFRDPAAEHQALPKRTRQRMALPAGPTTTGPEPGVRYGSDMSLLAFLFFGLIVGFVARALMPGKQAMGCFATALLGCVGSFAGGLLGNLVLGHPLLSLHRSGFIGSVIGAMLLLFLLRNRFR